MTPDVDRVVKALTCDKRRAILAWLRDPAAHFPPQVDGDLIADGVCSDFIADRLGVSAPTASRHLHLLLDASLVEARRAKQWVFYRRNEEGIRRGLTLLANELGLRDLDIAR